jgi:glycosyltransferase involved in cell wall biosynthesis
MGNTIMKISYLYPNKRLRLLGEELERRGHTIIFNDVDPTSDIVCSMSYSTQNMAAVAYRKGLPVLEFVHDIPAFRLMTVKWRMRYKSYANRLRKAKTVVATSKKTALDLWNYYHIESTVCYQSIDQKRFKPSHNTEKKQQIIQISRFVRHKNYDLTIQALKYLDGIEGVFCGIGNTQRLKELAKKEGVKVRFFAHASDEVIADELASSLLLVSPSSFEGLGLTPIEALLVGVPVVLNDLDVFREIYGDKVIYHRNRDAVDMANKIRLVLNSPDQGQKMVEACKPLIEIFSAEAFADRFQKILEGAVAN